jgi:hypothetical protein
VQLFIVHSSQPRAKLVKVWRSVRGELVHWIDAWSLMAF